MGQDGIQNKNKLRHTKVSLNLKGGQAKLKDVVFTQGPKKNKNVYSYQAEILNIITHSVGVGLALAAFLIMLHLSVINDDIYRMISSLIYTSTMILLFTSSVLYHSSRKESTRKLFKKFDHIAIFFFIAGTYTPALLVYMRNTTGIVLLSFVWLCAIAGLIMKLVPKQFSKLVNSLPYLIMGWMVVVFIKPFLNAVPQGFFKFFLLGGLFYTGGVLFYIKHTKFNHAIWHVFVILGCGAHFLGYYFYLF